MFGSAVRAILFRGTYRDVFSCIERAGRFNCPQNIYRSNAISGVVSRRNISDAGWNGYDRTGRTRRPIAAAPLFLGAILSFLGLESKEEEKEDPVIQTIKLGILNLQRGEYNKAERLLHIALKMSQERFDNQAETYCFDVMAEIATAKGELEKAEKLFIEVMRRLISSGTSQDDNSIVEISAKLAVNFSKRGDDAKAEHGFQFCIDTQRRKLKGVTENLEKVSLTPEEENSLALLGMCMDWYAKHLMDQGRHAEARELLVKSLEAALKVFGEDHPQTLTIRNDLAFSNTMLKDYKNSIRILEDLIASGAADESEDLPTFLCNLGENYLASGDLGNAERLCGRAEELAKKLKHRDGLKNARDCLAKVRESQKA